MQGERGLLPLYENHIPFVLFTLIFCVMIEYVKCWLFLGIGKNLELYSTRQQLWALKKIKEREKELEQTVQLQLYIYIYIDIGIVDVDM